MDFDTACEHKDECYSLKSIMLLQKSELAMDELVGVAIAVIALKYYVSAMFQVKYIIEYLGSLQHGWSLH